MGPQEIDHYKRSKGHDAYENGQNIDAAPPSPSIVGIDRKTNRLQVFLQLYKEADTEARD